MSAIMQVASFRNQVKCDLGQKSKLNIGLKKVQNRIHCLSSLLPLLTLLITGLISDPVATICHFCQKSFL